jgi:hypothetical protein
MQGVKLLSLLLVLVLANSFLNGSGSAAKDPLEFNPVASAAERVEKCPGMRLTTYVVYNFPALPQPVVGTGTGVYNAKTERSRFTLDLTGPTGEPMQFVEVTDGDVQYEGGSLVESQLPPGKEWVRTDESDGYEEGEPSLSVDDSLQMLGSSAEVQMVGRESINGKMTRRYRSEIQLSELVKILREAGKDEEADAYEQIEGLAPTEISAEGWIDRKNMLRRMRMVMPMPRGEPGDPPVTVDMRMDFFDYGAQPDIQIPDPDSVVEGPLDEDEVPSDSIS